MGGYNLRYIRLLIRQARASVAQPDTDDTAAKAWLQNLALSLLSSVQMGGQELISTTLNGKSIAFQIPMGMTATDAAIAAETALEWMESGHSPTSQVHTSFN